MLVKNKEKKKTWYETVGTYSEQLDWQNKLNGTQWGSNRILVSNGYVHGICRCHALLFKKSWTKPSTKHIKMLSKSLKVITDNEWVWHLSLHLDLVPNSKWSLAVLLSEKRGLWAFGMSYTTHGERESSCILCNQQIWISERNLYISITVTEICRLNKWKASDIDNTTS